MKASALTIGRTYFRLTFADRELTMPGVEPLVYLGEVTDDGGTHGFVFQDTVSYVQFGSGLEGDEQHEDIVLYFMPESDAGAMYDVEELAAEVAESASCGLVKPPASEGAPDRVEKCLLTNRWSACVRDKVPSPNRRSRSAQLNR